MPRRDRPRARDGRSEKPQRTRPTRIRHWKPTEIGSDGWWHGLRRLGVDRAAVEHAVEHCPRDAATEKLNPHSLAPPREPPARAAAHLLLFHRHPDTGYGTLMYVRHAWCRGNRSVKEWVIAQLVGLLSCGREDLSKPTRYLLWVDFFEVPDEARFVFPRLLKQLPRNQWKDVLEASGPVPWEVKVEAYRTAARDPAMHGWLAVGLARSFHDVFGSVDPAEARALYRRIEVTDAEVRDVLERGMTEPVRCRVLAVVTVDQTDERWTRWIPEAETQPSFLLLLEALDRPGIWMKSSELLLANRVLARVVHLSFPFDAAIRHHVSGTWREPDRYGIDLYRVLGDIGEARAAIGRVVEARPLELALRLER